MSKTKTAAALPAQPYPDRGGSFLLDEVAGTLTPIETAGETPVQDPVETTAEQEPR